MGEERKKGALAQFWVTCFTKRCADQSQPMTSLSPHGRRWGAVPVLVPASIPFARTQEHLPGAAPRDGDTALNKMKTLPPHSFQTQANTDTHVFKYREEGDPKNPEFTYNKLCVYSHRFKLQSPSKYPPFDAIYLSRCFFHGSKTVFELVDLDAF